MNNYIGKDIGRYHILEQIGVGGMAIVYKAYDTHLERNVAIKVIRTDQFAPTVLERMLKRFEREAKTLAKLTHPNIVSIIDYGEYEGSPYLVMPYLSGGTLKGKLGEPMSYKAAARLLTPIADALDYAHKSGVVHRDVKPSNILITAGGQPMLTDFGITKLLEASEGQTLTGTGVGVGTPEYMAPEQGLGKEVDGRADIYALGVVFYELVTGHKPYTADTPMAVIFKHMTDPLPRPRQFIPSLPEKVEQVLFKALAKKPEDRYQSMAEFAAALEGLAVGTVPSSETVQPKPTASEEEGEFQTETVDRVSLPPKVESPETIRKVEENARSDAALNKDHEELQTWTVTADAEGSLRKVESTGTNSTKEPERNIAEATQAIKTDDASEAPTTDNVLNTKEDEHPSGKLPYAWIEGGILAVFIIILALLNLKGGSFAAPVHTATDIPQETFTVTVAPAPTLTGWPTDTPAPTLTDWPTTEPTLEIGSTQISPIDGIALVTVSGKIQNKNSGDTYVVDQKAFDDESVEEPYNDPWFPDVKTYKGILLKGLITMVNPTSEVTTITLIASDGHTLDISITDAQKYDIMLARWSDGGTALDYTTGGPVKVVFPNDARTTYTDEKWMWWIIKIEFK